MKTAFKTLGLALAAGASSLLVGGQAQALSLVPQQEGEVQVGLGCSGPCVSLNPLISSVESLVDSSTGTKSRLFVDDLLTANTYGSIQFEAGDKGTTPTDFWFRPVEVEPAGSIKPNEENGQLEVGTFKFNFSKTIKSLKIAYFDTESKNTTGVYDWSDVLLTDGTLTSGNNPILKGTNSNIQYQTWENVNFITLKLGKDTINGTGDGVSFRMSVPEPTSMTSLAVMGIAGTLGALRKRRNSAEA